MVVRECMPWKKLCLLGAGSYGSVYLAAPAAGDIRYAVKSASTLGRISTLQVEKSLLQELKGSPYVIEGLGDDVSFEDGTLVYNLILEYACFSSFDKIIRRYQGHMPEFFVALHAYMLVKGLATIHSKDIVHCDIKPANILVSPFPGLSCIGLLKIADFGLSKKGWHFDRQRRFTPLYASPEAVTYGLQEKSCDIWALGCTVVEMITGMPLWNYNCPKDELFRQIVNENPRIPEKISEEGKDFLRRCLERDNRKRWTARMLLNHPFLVQNMKSRTGIHILSQEVTLAKATKPWRSSIDVFSTALARADFDGKMAQRECNVYTN